MRRQFSIRTALGIVMLLSIALPMWADAPTWLAAELALAQVFAAPVVLLLAFRRHLGRWRYFLLGCCAPAIGAGIITCETFIVVLQDNTLVGTSGDSFTHTVDVHDVLIELIVYVRIILVTMWPASIICGVICALLFASLCDAPKD